MKYFEDGRQISFVGADISKLQDYIDFQKVKKAGLDFPCLNYIGGLGGKDIITSEIHVIFENLEIILSRGEYSPSQINFLGVSQEAQDD